MNCHHKCPLVTLHLSYRGDKSMLLMHVTVAGHHSS